jgi:hypothetical protein
VCLDPNAARGRSIEVNIWDVRTLGYSFEKTPKRRLKHKENLHFALCIGIQIRQFAKIKVTLIDEGELGAPERIFS